MARAFSLLIVAVVVAGCVADVPSYSALESPTTTPTPAATSEIIPSPTPTAPMTPPPTPLPESLPADLDPELAQAVYGRLSYGLRADLEYVRSVAADPRASDREYGWFVYPEEFEDAQRRFEESSRTARIVLAYADEHKDEFGGLYIDEATHAGVVSFWTDDLSSHAEAIVRMTGAARVAFAQVRFAEAELRAIQDQILRDWTNGEFDDIPASVQGIGVDIKANIAFIDVSSANPEAEAIIAARLSFGDRLRVDSDGTGAALLPRGTVKGRVTPFTGPGRWDFSLGWTSEDPGDCGGGDIGYGMDDDGRFTLPCQIGTRTIIVYDGARRERGRATVNVTAGKTVKVTIHLDPPQS